MVVFLINTRRCYFGTSQGRPFFVVRAAEWQRHPLIQPTVGCGPAGACGLGWSLGEAMLREYEEAIDDIEVKFEDGE